MVVLEFQVLGEVSAVHDGRAIDLGYPRQRLGLVALLVDAGRVVPVDVLLERVWGQRCPPHARNALSGYVSRLRLVFRNVDGVELGRTSGGYRLTVDPLSVDLHRFRWLVAQARSATDDRTRLARFDQALGLWRGTAFGSLDSPWLSGVRAAVDLERFAVTLDRHDLALRLGRHTGLVAELSALADAHPLDERVAGQLMLALYRSGRQADALAHYTLVRTRLADELGIDPGPALRALHAGILAAEPELLPARPGPTRQLPAPPRHFAGRGHELDLLDSALAEQRLTVTAIVGTGGVGKTALALHWANRVADRFPDGQLHVDLRGFDPSGVALSADEALRGFLDALDVPAHRVPAEPAARTALYRSLLAERRMLVVLDNARDADHVRPLLPGTSASQVLVTSRADLTGLVTHTVTLDVLTAADARALIGQRVGADRVHASPDAVTELTARAAGLPLALAVIAARAEAHPEHGLPTLAGEFRRRRGLSDPREVFSWTYQTLSPPAARLFRLLGITLSAEFTPDAAATLAGTSVAATWPSLTELAAAHLITERSPGRFTMHDLLRAHAIDLHGDHDSAPDRRRATQRMLDHYLHSARRANTLVRGNRSRPDLDPPCRGVTPETFTDHRAATTWLTTEASALVAAVRRAEEAGLHDHTVRLAREITSILSRRARWPDLLTVQRAALESALRLRDRPALAEAHSRLAWANLELTLFDQAQRHLQEAITLYRDDDDPLGEAEAHLGIAWMFHLRRRQEDSLHHIEAALELCARVDDRLARSNALNSAAWIKAELGRELETAIAHCQEALTLQRETGDQLGEAATCDTLGYLHHRLGRHADALTWYHHSLNIHRTLGERYDETVILTHIGDTQHALGDTAAARGSWQQALTILVELGHPDADQLQTKLSDG